MQIQEVMQGKGDEAMKNIKLYKPI